MVFNAILRLKSLTISECDIEFDDAMENMGNLETVSVVNSDIYTAETLYGFYHVKNLTVGWSSKGAMISFSGLDEFPSLEELHLGEFEVDDFNDFPDIPTLKKLTIDSFQIADGDISGLARLDNLEELTFLFTDVDEAALEDLRERLPNCKIVVE